MSSTPSPAPELPDADSGGVGRVEGSAARGILVVALLLASFASPLASPLGSFGFNWLREGCCAHAHDLGKVPGGVPDFVADVGPAQAWIGNLAWRAAISKIVETEWPYRREHGCPIIAP